MGERRSGRPVGPPHEHIGIVTVTYNSAAVLGDFLAALENQSHERYTLYAIDNASSDGSPDRLAAWADPRLRLTVNTTNLGVAAANNQGILQANADRCSSVLLLNNDTVFPPDLLAALVAGLRGQGQEIVVPKIYLHSDPARLWCAGGRFSPLRAWAPVQLGEGRLDDGRFDAPGRLDYAPSCCMLIDSAVFAITGLMDPAYFVYFDEVDFCYRAARRSRLTIGLEPRARLWHKVGSLAGGKASDFGRRMNTRNRVYFLRKHCRPPVRWMWLAGYWLNILLRGLVGVDDRSACRIRRLAFSEGMAMPLPAQLGRVGDGLADDCGGCHTPRHRESG